MQWYTFKMERNQCSAIGYHIARFGNMQGAGILTISDKSSISQLAGSQLVTFPYPAQIFAPEAVRCRSGDVKQKYLTSLWLYSSIEESAASKVQVTFVVAYIIDDGRLISLSNEQYYVQRKCSGRKISKLIFHRKYPFQGLLNPKSG